MKYVVDKNNNKVVDKSGKQLITFTVGVPSCKLLNIWDKEKKQFNSFFVIQTTKEWIETELKNLK